MLDQLEVEEGGGGDVDETGGGGGAGSGTEGDVVAALVEVACVAEIASTAGTVVVPVLKLRE